MKIQETLGTYGDTTVLIDLRLLCDKPGTLSVSKRSKCIHPGQHGVSKIAPNTVGLVG